jgi:Ca2+-binding EF-hand superfamily protein
LDRSLVLGLAAFTLTAALLAIPAIANHHGAGDAGGPVTRQQMEIRIAERFVAADTDGSGTIDRDEARAHHAARRADRQASRFSRMDANGDGEINIAERDAAHTRRPGRHRINRGDMIVENSNMRARLTPEELSQLNPDSEQAAPTDASQVRRARHVERRNAAWAAADADENGALNGTEFETMASGRHHRRGRTHGTNRFDRMDGDRDGALTLAEMSARPLAMFERADSDHDGTVTREERRAARRAMREERRR